MEWINIHAPTLRAPEYIGSDPTARATWLNVLVYCCEQENGGRISGGAKWKDRQWQQTCGVTSEEVRQAGLLLVPDGDDILVWRYPSDKEAAVRAKRQGGARGGKASGKHTLKHPAKLPASFEQAYLEASGEASSKLPASIPTPIPSSIPPSIASTEGNGREGKENGMEGESSAPSAALAPSLEEAMAYGASPQGNTPANVVEIWWNDCQSRPLHVNGGFTDKAGCQIFDWRASLRAYGLRWRNNDAERRARGGSAADRKAAKSAGEFTLKPGQGPEVLDFTKGVQP